MEVNTSSNIINLTTNTRRKQNNNSGISSGSNSNTNNTNSINNLTKKIHQIQKGFIKNYTENLASFIPTIHTEFLSRVKYEDGTITHQELNLEDDKEPNVDFRKQIYLDFVLDKMDKIYSKQNNNNNAKEAAINKIYKEYTYDNRFNIEQPIKSLIDKSIIPNYDKIPKSDINLHSINSHGGVQRTIKKLQPNCIVVFITPFNRYTYDTKEHLAAIDEIISKISEQIESYDNNNIYDIVKMIEKYKCFDKSTIIYPNQYYFNYTIQTDYMCKGGRCYKSKQFQTFIPQFNTSLERYIDFYIKEKSAHNTVNVFFVKGCRSANDESYDNFTIEKMYIYENFIKILNRSISKKLSSMDLPIDSSIDCKIRIESKMNNVLTKRTTEDESKELILNSSLGSRFEDKEIYKRYLIFGHLEFFKPIIHNLLSKNKVNPKFSDKIDTDAIIKFVEDIKKIIEEESEIDNKQTYIINMYSFLFNIFKYLNKDDYKIILTNLINNKFYDEYDEYEKIKKEPDIDLNIFKEILINIVKEILRNKYIDMFDIKLLFDLVNLSIKIKYIYNSEYIIQSIFINNLDEIIRSMDSVINDDDAKIIYKIINNENFDKIIRIIKDQKLIQKLNNSFAIFIKKFKFVAPRPIPAPRPKPRPTPRLPRPIQAPPTPESSPTPTPESSPTPTPESSTRPIPRPRPTQITSGGSKYKKSKKKYKKKSKNGKIHTIKNK
jgi:hypothetical protein